jgi:sugar/nucleoside kinase (ribokinase family)
MNHYDILFVGHMTLATIVPFEGPSFVERGGPAFFGSIAASCLSKRIATLTRTDGSEGQLLEAMKAAGVDLYIQPGEIHHARVFLPTPNVDERQVFLIKRAGFFCIDDMPLVKPCLIHLAGMVDHEFSLEFMRALKARGFRLSVDMQSFIWQLDDQTGSIRLGDVREKQEILRMVDFVKLDAMEAKVLTDADVPKEQAEILEDWGSFETVITRADGVLARSKGKTTFERFTNRSTRGRIGRGDTLFGAYLARRLNHSVEDSLRFAAALTSIKMESLGPFKGSLEDVIERMNGSISR